jgi:hypothetical protein
LKIEKPEIALKLLDMDAVEYDTEGKPTNIEALLKAVIAELPSLVAPTDDDATKGKAQTAQTSTGGSINTQRVTGAPAAFDPRNPPRLTDSSLWSAPAPKRS